MTRRLGQSSAPSAASTTRVEQSSGIGPSFLPLRWSDCRSSTTSTPSTTLSDPSAGVAFPLRPAGHEGVYIANLVRPRHAKRREFRMLLHIQHLEAGPHE